MEMIINTIRMIEYDQAKEHAFGDNETLKANLAIALINPEELKALNRNSNSNLKITSQFGSVVLRIQEDKNVPKGMVCIPVSIWANQVTGMVNDQLIYKNFKAEVEPCSEPVLGLQDLILQIKPNT